MTPFEQLLDDIFAPLEAALGRMGEATALTSETTTFVREAADRMEQIADGWGRA